MSGTGLAAAVRAATQPAAAGTGLELPLECSAAIVRMFGFSAAVFYRVDEAEVERRRRDQAQSITALDVLDALMELPIGLPVPPENLSAKVRAAVRRAPMALRWHEDGLVRTAVAPLRVHLAVVGARDLASGVVKAGRFAPYCSRAVLLPSSPPPSDDLLVRASYFGTGACVLFGGQLKMALNPAPYVRQRHTAAQWRFTEEIWRQVSASWNASDVT